MAVVALLDDGVDVDVDRPLPRHVRVVVVPADEVLTDDPPASTVVAVVPSVLAEKVAAPLEVLSSIVPSEASVSLMLPDRRVSAVVPSAQALVVADADDCDTHVWAAAGGGL